MSLQKHAPGQQKGNKQLRSVFLLEQLAKSGNNADYIDYKTQKRYNDDNSTEDIYLPELSVNKGANMISVGTIVQPLSVNLCGRVFAN